MAKWLRETAKISTKHVCVCDSSHSHSLSCKWCLFFYLILNICFPSFEGTGTIKNCVTRLIRGRKSIGDTQNKFLAKLIWFTSIQLRNNLSNNLQKVITQIKNLQFSSKENVIAVYFYQHLSAANSKRWLKSALSMFFGQKSLVLPWCRSSTIQN